ncbi:MAG: hypothetical protein K1X72_25100 [Pyrinomonadaceae bacterium]|nr:hypothetical protein [Pyrinomonadaceae bacterium]
MEVEFHKTGEKRYAVIILRDNLPKLEMNPAPGFDPLMPHDMLHFLVEQEFGLHNAIFGQVASGGTAGTFLQRPSESKNSRKDSRQRRKVKQSGEKMLKGGIDECVQSERATYVCWQDWLAHSAKPNLKEQADEMKMAAQSILGQMDKAERERFNDKNLQKIRTRMDEVSQRWANLKIGEFISLKW